MSAAQLIVEITGWIALPILAAAFLLSVWRVVKGPTLPDRVVALDMLVGIVIGFIALIAIRTGFTLYIDIAIALGLVGFLATVAFARFILVSAKSVPADTAKDAPSPARADMTSAGAASKKSSSKKPATKKPAVKKQPSKEPPPKKRAVKKQASRTSASETPTPEAPVPQTPMPETSVPETPAHEAPAHEAPTPEKPAAKKPARRRKEQP